MKIDGECLIKLIGSCRNKVQVYRSVRMPQLRTSLHFHLTPIVMINSSSRCDLLLNSQNFCYSVLAGTENPLPSRLRALILGWAYYLDAFSSYPLRTWSVYRGHDNWYTRGASFSCPDRYAFRVGQNIPDKKFCYLRTVIVTAAIHRGFGHRLSCHQSPEPGHYDPFCKEAPLLLKLWDYFFEFLRESCLTPLGILYLPTCVSFRYRYPFVEGCSSFSWEYSMGYFSAVAPGPDSPSMDELCGGTLGFSGHWILTNVCVTQADILASTSFGRSLSLIHLRRKSARSANLLAVSAPLPPLSLSGHLGALAGDPGCFPLDGEAYPPSSHWPTSTLVILRSYLVLKVCLDLVPLSWPAPKQCFTPRCPVNCCASTHFGENQLALGSSDISPLTTTHPLILQHQLACGQSPGLLPLLGSLRFHVLFHSPTGVLFTLPSRYYFAIGHPRVFSLARWSLLIHKGFHMPHAARAALISLAATVGIAFAFFSFPPATKMFQFARLSIVCPWIQQQFERLTYSRIFRSTLIFKLPEAFHQTNCRIEKIGYYHIALFRLSSRVRDKRTRTTDIYHRNSYGSGGSCYRKTRNGGELSPLRLFGLKNAGNPINLFRPRIISSWAWSYFTIEKRKKASISKFNSDPHLPVQLPCYDFTHVTSLAFGIPLFVVKVTTLGMASSHSVTGGVYKARE
ncbi:hypothetical protein ES332_A05G359600v1 [Gossypium tomentosum]|uniref:Uncharacterized protein n=1 Tax=Gossypium tomentosum TaxID=34277 RepID=A0A5D2QNQ6_GOSTO|nr:hypothetical protein ES332_A05G359600v1 [Gossypium tomentosum]